MALITGINTALVYSLFYLLICLFVSRGIIPTLLYAPEHEDQAIQFAAYNSVNVMLFSIAPFVFYLLFELISLRKRTTNKSVPFNSEKAQMLSKCYLTGIICTILLIPLYYFVTSTSFESGLYYQMTQSFPASKLNIINTINRSYDYSIYLILGAAVIIDVTLILLKAKQKSLYGKIDK